MYSRAKDFSRRWWRVLSVKDLRALAVREEKLGLIAVSVFGNGLESTSKILAPYALAAALSLVAKAQNRGSFLGSNYTPEELLFLSVFFNFTQLTLPYLKRAALLGLDKSFARNLTAKLLKRSQALSLEVAKERLGSDLIRPLQQHMYEANCQAPLLVSLVTDHLQPLFFDTALGTLVTFIRFGPIMGGVVLGYLIFATTLNEMVAKYVNLEEHNNQIRELFTTYVSSYFEVLNNAETVNLFNRSRYELTRAESRYKEYREKQITNDKRKLSGIVEPLLNSLTQLLVAIYLVVVGFNKVDLDDIIFLFGYVANIGRSINAINSSFRGAAESISSIDHLQSFLKNRDEEPLVAVVKDPRMQAVANADLKQALLPIVPKSEIELSSLPPKLKLAIEFKNVAFSYNKGEPILEGMSFQVPCGKFTAIVGPTNCGKTTFAKLITKLINPRYLNGTILIHGQDIKELQPEVLRALVAVAKQEIELFKDHSAKYNILYGYGTDQELGSLAEFTQKTSLSSQQTQVLEESLHRVAGQAAISHLLARTNSRSFSGGETQRIGIARVLERPANICIFDEPTSSLDSQTERQVLASIQTATKNKTVIMIAHRLSTIKNADHILFFKKPSLHAGTKVVEQGTHQELIDLKGEYEHLWNLQTQVGLKG